MKYDKDTIMRQLQRMAGDDRVQADVSMEKYTTFRAGGPADLMVQPADTAALQQVLTYLTGEEIPHMVLGNGSNVLVRDGGYRGVILRIGRGFDQIRQEEDAMVCGSGVSLAMAAKAAAQAGLTGLEFASGIPGSIGGAVFMNAGAYDGQMADVLDWAEVLSPDGTILEQAKGSDLDLGYRHSRLQTSGEIVIAAKLQLQPGDREAIWEKMRDLADRRNAKQPVTYPSAGSFFKRPEGHFAGKLIQDAGCKGLTVGGAQVSTLHSGFVINRGGATATDILQLAQIVQARVQAQFGVSLEPEVRIIGE